MSIAKFYYLLILSFSVSIATFAQNPHILVNDADKQSVIKKIQKQ